MSVAVEPWPFYADDGGAPSWWVDVTTSKRTLRLIWSGRSGRFARGWNSMHLRRSAPAAYREAVDFMQRFCQKMQRPAPAECVTHERDTSAQCVTLSLAESVTLLRAHAEPTVFSTECHCHARRDSVTVTRDSDSPPLRSGTVTITQAKPVDRQQEHKARLAKDARFAGWVAGSKA
jgi:hypothetical protein